MTTVKTLCILSCLLCFAACKEKEALPKKTPANTAKAPAPAPAEPTADKPEADGERDVPTVKAHMQEHFALVRPIQEAIVFGDLQSVQGLAQQLVEHNAHEDLTDALEELAELKKLATELTKAETLEAAATGAAKVAGQCGACHISMTQIASFEWVQPPEDDGTTPARMRRHQWAMHRLWEGIVAPSAELWDEGIEVLSKSPLPPSWFKKINASEKQIRALSERLALLSESASSEKLVEHTERVAAYGELLSTCQTCHAKRKTEEK